MKEHHGVHHVVPRVIGVVFVPFDVHEDVGSQSMLQDPWRSESDVRLVEVALEFGECFLPDLAFGEFVEVHR